ncbi:helix-turn-helix domain-containing protein [Maribacter sp. 2307ULW6-5]|uniref:helix-turn-helix domain-containing protein n=1 Tax=Maribacter sp. 2307ULW6-5 TaxID=3386275 RepID=UPI0039BD8FDD
MNGIFDLTDFNHVLKLLRFKQVPDASVFHICRLEHVLNKKQSVETPLYRQHFFDITLFMGADFEYSYSFHREKISKNTLQIVPPRKVQRIMAEAPTLSSLKGYTLLFKPQFLSIASHNANFIETFPFFSYSNNDCVVKLSYQDSTTLCDLFERMVSLYEGQVASTTQILNGYLWALLHTVNNIWLKHTEHVKSPIINTHHMVASFESAVHNHLKATTKVSAIAELLHVSPKFLSETLKKETGLNAKQLLDRALFLEAKMMLAQTHSTISQISHFLHFSDVSNFSKFFKRMSGLSPSDFRGPK